MADPTAASAADSDDEDDASSLVDAAFGTAKPKAVEEEAESELVGDDGSIDSDDADPAEEPAEPAAVADNGSTDSDDADADSDADGADFDAADTDTGTDTSAGQDAAEESAEEPAGPAPVLSPAPDNGSTDTADESGTRAKTLTRGRLAGAAAVVLAVGAACALVLSGSSTSSGSAAPTTPAAAPASTPPSVNPQASYPDAADVTPFSTGAKASVLTDRMLLAAVPDCGSCKLVTRANGFSPDGAALALFRTGDPMAGKSNFKLVVVGADGKLVWSAPPGVKALTAGIERFSTDKAGNFYLALPGEKSGQILIALTWKDGHVVDIGDLTNPKISSDSVVGVLPEPTPGATATIVSQTRNGVSDADTGGLIESQYQIQNGVPVLIGCRRHVGESGEWIPFKPSAQGCVDAPPGPVGPPDGDGTTTAP